jgi:hypothetical protein
LLVEKAAPVQGKEHAALHGALGVEPVSGVSRVAS